MLVSKAKTIPTLFNGIELLSISRDVEVSVQDIIRKKINTNIAIESIGRNKFPEFLFKHSDNVIMLDHEVKNNHADTVFIVDDGFKIDQKYYDYILSIIKSNWDKNSAKIAIDLKDLGFHAIANIIKEKTGEIVRSWDELGNNVKIIDLLEFGHIKDRLKIIKALFLYHLSGISTGYIRFAKSIDLKSTINEDGFLIYQSNLSYIDRFECRVSGEKYLCDFNNVTVTMYPKINDLMNDYEIKRFLAVSKRFGKSSLIIKTSLESLGDADIHVRYDAGQFTRTKSTSTLVLNGITSQSFIANFGVTAEFVKSILAKYNKKKVGLKHEIMERLGELCDELCVKHNDALSKYFNTNMVIKQINWGPEPIVPITIEGIDSEILGFVMYVYIKNRVHGSSLFLKDGLNGLYNAANDFSKKDQKISIQFMRLNERIT